MAPASAHGHPRDQVMSSAYGCAEIANSRRWLDCYYGSAQPARAQLGLPPALDAQVRLALAPPSDGEPADANIRDDVMAASSRCLSIDDNRKWLNCYYGASEAMRTRLGLPLAMQAPMIDRRGGNSHVTDGSRNSPQQFGLAPSSSAGPQAVDHLASRMVSYSFDDHHIFTVSLATGQQWKQLSGDTDYAHWKKSAAAYLVTITRGYFGSYNLQVQGDNGVFKVLRLK